MFEYTNKCALLVSTSDDYESTWYPYFELIKKYWKNHPVKIFLNSETKSYFDEELNIKNILSKDENTTWSQRLYYSLEQIEEEYVFFSLEDFFLLGDVKDEIIEQCLKWMEENKSIAVCRLMPSNDEKLISTKDYNNFRIAGDDVPFRLDTQFALWRKKDLMSFIDLTETPWQFESNGTERIKGIDKIFLWCYSPIAEDISMSAFPYHIFQLNGYGVAWGRWLWKNKKWFKINNIKKVNYSKLGCLSQCSVKLRFKYLYRAGKKPAKGLARIVQWTYKQIDKIEKSFAQLRINGLKKGIKRIKEKRRKKE